MRAAPAALHCVAATRDARRIGRDYRSRAHFAVETSLAPSREKSRNPRCGDGRGDRRRGAEQPIMSPLAGALRRSEDQSSASGDADATLPAVDPTPKQVEAAAPAA